MYFGPGARLGGGGTISNSCWRSARHTRKADFSQKEKEENLVPEVLVFKEGVVFLKQKDNLVPEGLVFKEGVVFLKNKKEREIWSRRC